MAELHTTIKQEDEGLQSELHALDMTKSALVTDMKTLHSNKTEIERSHVTEEEFLGDNEFTPLPQTHDYIKAELILDEDQGDSESASGVPDSQPRVLAEADNQQEVNGGFVTTATHNQPKKTRAEYQREYRRRVKAKQNTLQADKQEIWKKKKKAERKKRMAANSKAYRERKKRRIGQSDTRKTEESATAKIFVDRKQKAAANLKAWRLKKKLETYVAWYGRSNGMEDRILQNQRKPSNDGDFIPAIKTEFLSDSEGDNENTEETRTREAKKVNVKDTKKTKKGSNMPKTSLEHLKSIVAKFMNSPPGWLLWDNRLQAHTDQRETAAAWKKLAALTGEECELLKSVWRLLKGSYRRRIAKAEKSEIDTDKVMESWEYYDIMRFYHEYQSRDYRDLCGTLQLATDTNDLPVPLSSNTSDNGCAPSPSSRSSTLQTNCADQNISNHLKRRASQSGDDEDQNMILKKILSLTSQLLSDKSEASNASNAPPTLKFESYWQSLEKMWSPLPDSVTTSLFCKFVNLTSEAIAAEKNEEQLLDMSINKKKRTTLKKTN